MYLIQWSFMDMVSICTLNQSSCSPSKSYSIQSSTIYHKHIHVMLILQTCIINVVVVINISRLSTYFLCLVNETDYQQKMSLK